MDVEKEIRILLKNVRDNGWWIDNERKIKDIFNNETNRRLLKKAVLTEKRFQAIEALDKLNIFLEENLVIEILKKDTNINRNMYYYLYKLFQRNIISRICLEKVKEKFKSKMKNADMFFLDVETKFVISKIEKDRQYFKKIREDNFKVKDIKEELSMLLKSAERLKKEDIKLFNCIQSFDIVVFLFNMDALFRLDAEDFGIKEVMKQIKGSIRSLQRNFRVDDSVTNLRPTKGIYNRSQEMLGHLSSSNESRQINLLKRVYMFKDFAYFKNFNALKLIDQHHKNQISLLRRVMKELNHINADFYCISKSTLTEFLATLIIFDFEFVNFKNVISTNKNETLDSLIAKINVRQGSKIISFELEFDQPSTKQNVCKYYFGQASSLFRAYLE